MYVIWQSNISSEVFLNLMMPKENLVGKHIEFIDRDGKRRIEKVVRIKGKWITTKNVLGRRRRVRQEHVLGRMRPKLGMEEIQW
jgi:hypothetical protein